MAISEPLKRQPRPASRLDFVEPEPSIAEQIYAQVRAYEASLLVAPTVEPVVEELDLLDPITDLLSPTADLLMATTDLLAVSVPLDLLRPSDLLRAPDLLRPASIGLCGSAGDLLSGPSLEQRQQARKIINRVVLVLPPVPQSSGLWWMPAHEYEDCFKVEPVAWGPGSVVDIDMALGSLHSMGLSVGGQVQRLWAREIPSEHASMVGFTDVAWAPKDELLWQKIMTRYANIRDDLMDVPDRLFKLPLARTNAIKHMAHWAGMKPADAASVHVSDFVDRAGEPDYRTVGMLAAGVDLIAWQRPDWLPGGVEMLQWLMKLSVKPWSFEVPRDNFFFREFHHPIEYDGASTGSIAAMRGEYVVVPVVYVSAAGMMQDKAPYGVPGWRQCGLVPSPSGFPSHVCHVDCYSPDRDCGQHGKLLNGVIELDPVCHCGKADCGEFSMDPH